MSENADRLLGIAERAVASMLADPEFRAGDRFQAVTITGSAEEHDREGAVVTEGYDEDDAGTRAAMLDLVYNIQQMGITAGVRVSLARPGGN